MQVTIANLVCLLIGFLIGLGSYQFYWLYVIKKGYSSYKEDNETFLDYCVRFHDDIIWKVRKKLNISWFYNSKLFIWYIKGRGVLMLILAILLSIALIIIKNSSYSEYLNIVL